jgi:hypothetical protein
VTNSYITPVSCGNGEIFVPTTLLDLTSDDAALETILAHETGHIELHHSRAQGAENVFAEVMGWTLSIPFDLLSKRDDAQAKTLGAAGDMIKRGVSTGMRLGYSREAEWQADDVAIIYSVKRFGTTRPFIRVLRLLGANPARYDTSEALRSTHPTLGARLRAATSARVLLDDHCFIGWGDNGEPLVRLDLERSIWSTHEYPRAVKQREGRDSTLKPLLTSERTLTVFASATLLRAAGDTLRVPDIFVAAAGQKFRLHETSRDIIRAGASRTICLAGTRSRGGSDFPVLRLANCKVGRISRWTTEDGGLDSGGRDHW